MSFNTGNIAPTDLKDYIKSLGWQILPQGIGDGLYVMTNPNYARRQIIFPTNSGAPDYADAIEISLKKLSEIYEIPVQTIITLLSEVKEDALRFRIVNVKDNSNYIPLSYAVEAINGAKDLFLSAACSVLKPQFHHPRLSRTEAWRLLEASRFRHTETGSFVLKVSSPVNAIDYQGSFFDEDIPFVRQTTLVINHGMSQLVAAIQGDTMDRLIDDIKADPKPEISSNLCKALMNFKEENDSCDLYVDFAWAGVLKIPANIRFDNQVKIQRDYFPRIDEIYIELRNTEQHRKQEETFMATVENLGGEIGTDGLRSGDIVLNLYQEGEIIKAKTQLDAKQYIDANRAHMTTGAFIKVKGKLHPGNQPRHLSDVTTFDLILP